MFSQWKIIVLPFLAFPQFFATKMEKEVKNIVKHLVTRQRLVKRESSLDVGISSQVGILVYKIN